MTTGRDGGSKRYGSIGIARHRPLRSDWEDINDRCMYKDVHAKLPQHTDCTDILLATGDAELIEHTKNDSYWADGGHAMHKSRAAAHPFTAPAVIP